jgi:flagellar basal-body rod protein FlgC
VQSGGFGAQLAKAVGAGSASGSQPGGVEVAGITQDQTPGKLVYDPGHPDADAKGYVRMPNVDTVAEMVDLISASRAYEANVTAMNSAKQMFSKTLDLLR